MRKHKQPPKCIKKLGKRFTHMPRNLEIESKERLNKYKKIYKKNHYDPRELWNLDYSLVLWVYPRLKALYKIMLEMIDLDCHKVWHNGREYTIGGAILYCLDIFEIIIKDDYYDSNCSETLAKINDGYMLFGKIIPYLWW